MEANRALPNPVGSQYSFGLVVVEFEGVKK